MIVSRFLWLCVPLFLLVPLWVSLVRHYRATKKITIAAIVCATIVAFRAASLYVRIARNPALRSEPPWKGINLDAALLGFIGPVAVIVGLIAAFKGARWWQVLLIELSSIPLTLIGAPQPFRFRGKVTRPGLPSCISALS